MENVPAGKAIEIPGLGTIHEGSPEAAWLGPVLGMAVGDALGTSYEFAHIEQPPYPTLATGPATDVVGGGPFELTAGQITDDTQMAICLARSLLAHHAGDLARGASDGIDLRDLATRYLAWFEHAFDVGNQTGSALQAIARGTPVAEAGREVWHRSGRQAAGNGSLMRTAPIGAVFARAALRPGHGELLVETALLDSIVTHADPRCAIACAAFDMAIAHGVARWLDGRPTSGYDLVEAARAVVGIAADRLRTLWRDDAADVAAIDAGEADVRADLDAALGTTPQVHGPAIDLHRTAGFVRVALRLAFWHVVHTPSWRDAVIDVASRGGDADTNAAIVGALLGARDGALAIPPAWIDRVLAATQPGPPDWAAAHHPEHLVALVGALRRAQL